MGEPVDLYPDVFDEIVRRRRGGQVVVLCTVVEVRGSTPRAPGARMLVLADGSIRGTIGGGAKEAEIIELARRLLRDGGSSVVSLDCSAGLTGGDGPVCGGTMEVFMERLEPPRRVVIAGAGHIGYFLHRFLTVLEFHTIILDDRPDFACVERFPGATLRVQPFEEALADLALAGPDGVVIVTPGHVHDEQVLRVALATEAGYIGMIGSRKKVATVLARLERDGFAPDQLGRVHAPVGLDIGAETPAEIALAIAAEIVSLSKSMKVPPRRA